MKYTHTRTHIHTHTEDVVHNIGSIGPNAEVTYTFNIIGLKLGKHQLVVGLDSDKVEMVTGEKQVHTLTTKKTYRCIASYRPSTYLLNM